jgi:hypothetical protein
MSLQTQFNFNDSSPVHTYYDINILNNDTIGLNDSVPIVFTDTRTDTIIKNPSEYFISVTNFEVDTPSLPLFVPLIDTNISSVGNYNTIYKVAVTLGKLQNGNKTVIIPIKFTPQDLTLPNPSLASIDANNIQEYFYLYSYTWFIDCINSSIINALKDSAQIADNFIPQFTFDTNTNKASIYFPQNATFTQWGGNYLTQNGVNTYFLMMNAPLYNLFSSFKAQYVESIPLTVSTTNDAGWYNIVINPPITVALSATANFYTPDVSNLTGNHSIQNSVLPNRNIIVYPPATVSDFSVITQDYPTTPLWNPVQNIVITTALMPIANELTGVPNIFNSENISASNNNRNISPILCSIDIPTVRGDELKPTINYTPIVEYKLTDLNSNIPVNSIQISVFWRDNYNTLHPLLLDAGCTATIKLMFRKKIFNFSPHRN